jgi:Raf kinase inhibitor-like YbhB/YbcL family protein
MIYFYCMKKIVILFVFCTFFISKSKAQSFTLTSNSLGGQLTLENVFNGCGGQNVSPQFSWANAPKGTKSFALLCHDESAPTGSGWWHWLVFDMPATTTNLPKGAGTAEATLLPKTAIQSISDFGVKCYGGPCPPEGHGFHKYTFTIYALSVEKLGVDANTNPAKIGFMVNANTIEKASLVAYYKRDKK